MNIFSRFIDIINANMNAMLDKAEDPEKMLRLMIREMEDTLIELKSSCAASISEGAKLRMELSEAREAEKRWSKRAELAVAGGRDDLAREAIAEKLQMRHEAEQLEGLMEENSRTVEEAKKNISELEGKLSESKARFRILHEKQERIRNSRKAQSSMQKDTESRFRDMEDRLSRMGMQQEMDRSTEHRFEDLEKSEEIEKELEELRKKTGQQGEA